jgi:hypothetical protein
MPGPTRTAVLAVTATLLTLQVHAQEITTSVTAGDGVRLATDVYCPMVGCLGSWPVVLQRTPYGRGALEAVCRTFNLWGFACVAQDVRGRGDSEGHDTVFRDDGPDGHATIDWITRQRWCDGTIGTFGGSALGITQYALAPGAPAALKASVPVVATPDFYHHAAVQGGALREALTYNWLEGQGSLDFWQLIRQHRLYDAFWRQVEVLPRAADVRAAGLHVGGWYDIFLQGTLDAFTTFQHRGGPGAAGAQKLLVGPWTHATLGQNVVGELVYPSNAIAADDLPTMFRDFLQHHLQGGRADVARWPAARVYLMGAAGELNAPGNVWVELDDWPPAAGTVPYYLTPSGGLLSQRVFSGQVELPIDPANPVPTRGGAELFPDLVVDGRPMGAGPADQRTVEARTDVLEFSTSLLIEPVTVMGRVKVRLWVVPDTPDLDLAVRLTDVYPDGRSMLVTDGIARARMRCGDDRECLLTPGLATEITIDLWSTAIVFNAMHRIRIDISGSNAPRFEVNPNDGRDLNLGGPGVVARPKILMDAQHPSRLELPVPGAPRVPRRMMSRR